MFNSISPAYIWLVPSWSGDSPSFFHSNDLIPLLWACQWLPPPYLGRGRFQTITVVFDPFCEVLRAKTYFYELDFSTLPFLAASGSHSQRAPDTVPAPSLKVHRSPTAWALAPDPSSLKFPLTITISKPLAACATVQEVDQCNVFSSFISSYCYNDATGGNLRANFAQPLMFHHTSTGIIYLNIMYVETCYCERSIAMAIAKGNNLLVPS